MTLWILAYFSSPYIKKINQKKRKIFQKSVDKRIVLIYTNIVIKSYEDTENADTRFMLFAYLSV